MKKLWNWLKILKGTPKPIYEAKNKRISESGVKKHEELKHLSSNHATSKNSNDIILKGLKIFWIILSKTFYKKI